MNSKFETYCHLRDLFAATLEDSAGLDAVLRHPVSVEDLPAQALQAWAAVLQKKKIAPFCPLPADAGISGELPNLALACQMALLWASLAERNSDARLKEEAEKLANFLHPLVREKLWTLWTQEKEYKEREIQQSIDLFLHATKQREMELPEQPFFRWLHQKNVSLSIGPALQRDFGYELFCGENSALVLTLAGKRTAAGAMRIGSISIPAFGPQRTPLNDPMQFGIEGTGERRWFCASSYKEAWFQIERASADSFVLQSIGISPSSPIFFSFYVCAEQCKIEERVFKPKSLSRFSGEGNKVEFSDAKSKICLETSQAMWMELIPLAGGDSFWGASFLVAFWLPAFSGKIEFHFHSF